MGGKKYPIPSPTAPQNTENLSDTPKAPQLFFLEHFKIDLEMQIFRLLVASAYLLAVATGQNKLRIMPLGDSITETTCWRTLLWDNLIAASVADKVEFVGTMTDNIQNCIGKTATWDHHHEGHSGYLAIDIANYDLVGWLISARPDVVMFMLGTNDVLQGHSTSEILAAYTEMVQEMRTSNPRMKILIDLVIPLPFLNEEIAALNAAIPPWARSRNSTASPIYFADCNTDFPSTDLRDGIHPNAAGDEIISSRLYPILLQIINQTTQSLITTQKGLLVGVVDTLLGILGI